MLPSRPLPIFLYIALNLTNIWCDEERMMTTRFFHKNFENEDLETKNLFPQQWPYEQCKREKHQVKRKMEKEKLGWEGKMFME